MKTLQELENENIALRHQIQILEETFRAIKMGEVDAVVISNSQGERVFTLQDADYPYRVFIPEMHEGAVTLDEYGNILYCNQYLSVILKKPLQKIIGSNFSEYVAPSEKHVFAGLFQQERQATNRGELNLIADDETQISVYLSFTRLQIDNVAVTCLVVTDLTEQKRNAEIIAAERLATSIFEQAAEAIIVCDVKGQIIRANQAAQEVCGKNPLFQQFDVAFPLQCNHYSSFQEIEAGWLSISNRSATNKPQNLPVVSLSSLLQGQDFQGVEVSFKREDGREFNLLLSASPLLNSDNHMIGSVVTLTNITERKQIEEKMAQLVLSEQAACSEAEATKQHLSNILESISDAFIAIDNNWCYSYLNKKTIEIFGGTKEDLIGKNIWQEISEEFSQNYYQIYVQAFTEQSFFQIEAYYPSIQRWCENRIYPSVDGVSIFFKDITQQKQTEIALQENEEHFRLALEAAQMGTWDWNALTNEIKWSTRHEQLFGLAPGTFAGNYEAFISCVHPEDRETLNQAIITAQNEKCEYYQEFRVIWPDSSQHWIAGKGKFFSDSEGKAVRMIGTVMDISVQKQAEVVLQSSKAALETQVAERTAELSKANTHLHRLINVLTAIIAQQTRIEAQFREAERRWRSLLDNVQLLVIGLDSKGNVEYVNPFFLRLSGYTQEEVLGKSWVTHFIPQHQQQDIEKVFREMLKEDLHIHYVNKILTKFGEEQTIAWNNTLLRDAQGQIIGTMSIGEDITKREALDKIKNEFISVVSHELRTPMTSIQGGLNLLSRGIVKPESDNGKRIIEIAAENAERLVRLVNDILDLERLQSGKITLIRQKVDAADLLAKSADLMQLMFQKSEINLSVSSQSIELVVDQDRIIQVLTNLLSNAIKFSPPGSTVWMTVEKMSAKDAQAPSCLFKVQDQGRGIPRDKIEAIFERFHQVDASDSRMQGGTGLGLAICRSIVEQHKGQIWVESTVDVGSSFYVKLPL